MALRRVTAKRVVAFVLAAIVVAGAWYLASPLFITTNANVGPPAGFTQVVKQGTWQGADGVHRASGVAKLLTDGQGGYVLRLEDFSVTNGPDIEFFLSTDAAYDGADVGLGDVGATTGSYNVAIPAGTDVASYDYAIIWCVPFRVLFATARLA
ncbi:MAG: DM13 domain-containing protein [Methanobacteriota archaeon]